MEPLKIEKDDGDGSGNNFASLLQRRAAKAAESNRGLCEAKVSEADLQWKKVFAILPLFHKVFFM